ELGREPVLHHHGPQRALAGQEQHVRGVRSDRRGPGRGQAHADGPGGGQATRRPDGRRTALPGGLHREDRDLERPAAEAVALAQRLTEAEPEADEDLEPEAFEEAQLEALADADCLSIAARPGRLEADEIRPLEGLLEPERRPASSSP